MGRVASWKGISCKTCNKYYADQQPGHHSRSMATRLKTTTISATVQQHIVSEYASVEREGKRKKKTYRSRRNGI